VVVEIMFKNGENEVFVIDNTHYNKITINLNKFTKRIINTGKLLLRIFFRLYAVVIFISIWEISARLEVINPIFLPPFSHVIRALWKLLISGELFTHASISLLRSFGGFVFGLSIAIPLGLVIGWFKKFERFIDPLMQTFRNLSVLALLPVFVLILGIGEVSKVAVITWSVIWAVLLNTISGVKGVDPLIIKGAKSTGISKFLLFVKVILPGALFAIFTGIRLSATTSILVLIAAEMLGANTGLGYLLYFYQANIKIPEMFSIIIVLALLGLTVNYSLAVLEKKLFKWKEEIPDRG
jgi:NitT/TauT family transport system permease protein